MEVCVLEAIIFASPRPAKENKRKKKKKKKTHDRCQTFRLRNAVWKK